ncbi:MAG: hypothetical protein ABF868_04225 [Sporolactobacillus sp.]
MLQRLNNCRCAGPVLCLHNEGLVGLSASGDDLAALFMPHCEKKNHSHHAPPMFSREKNNLCPAMRPSSFFAVT